MTYSVGKSVFDKFVSILHERRFYQKKKNSVLGSKQKYDQNFYFLLSALCQCSQTLNYYKNI